MSPPLDGVDVGACVGAAVGAWVAVGLAETVGATEAVLPLPVVAGGEPVPEPPATVGGGEPAAVGACVGATSAGDATGAGVSVAAGTVAGGGVVGTGTVMAAVPGVAAEPESPLRAPKMKRSASAGRRTHAAAIAAIAALRAPAFFGPACAEWGPVPAADESGGGGPNEGGPAGTTEDIGVGWR